MTKTLCFPLPGTSERYQGIDPSQREQRYEYLLHDRDSIFAKHLDNSIERLGVTVLITAARVIEMSCRQ